MSLLFLLLFFSCRGQQQNKIKEASTKAKRQFNIEGFNTQKDQVEINTYKLYYNGSALGVDSLKAVQKILGNPSNDRPEIVYDNKPFWLGAKVFPETDSQGNVLYEYAGKKVKYFKGMLDKQYKDLYERESDGTLKALVYQYSVLFRPFVPKFKADFKDSLLMKIPALNGAVLVNGFPVTKDTPLDSFS